MNLSFDPNVDHYKALGVTASASAAEIKKAYRRLAKKYHPDSTGGDKSKEARFKQVGAAYDVLGDDKKRSQYDAIRAGGYGPSYGSPHGPGPQHNGGFSFGGLEDLGDLGALFSQFSSGGPSGGVRFRTGNPFSARTTKSQPPAPANQERKRRASDGSTLLQRGNNIHSDVRIALDQAVLGTVIEVATLTGKASVKVPPGTSSGAKLRLRNKGVASGQGKHGDHLVTIQIQVPKKVNQRAKELLAEFMAQAKKS